MDIELLTRFFGPGGDWRGPCVVITEAAAALHTTGPDSLSTGGVKVYAPRLASGRIEADAVCLLADYKTLLVVQEKREQQNTGEERVTRSLLALDAGKIVGVEFASLEALSALSLPEPHIEVRREYRPGTLVG